MRSVSGFAQEIQNFSPKNCETLIKNILFARKPKKMSEVEETISRIKSHKSVEGLLITDKEKRIIRTNYTGDKAPEVTPNFSISIFREII
jgi:hypothetical protein